MRHTQQQGSPRWHSIALLLSLLALGVTGRGLRGRAMERYLEAETYEDLYYLPPPVWLVGSSLGHREMLADLIWIRALLYYGEELGQHGRLRHIFHYADAILELDPDFRRAYHWAGMAGLYRAQQPTLEEMYGAASYLERGVLRFPRDGEMAWDLGATLLYEIHPWVQDEAERRELRQRATEHLMAAARLGAGPPWLALSNATRLGRLGELEQAARHLEEMHASVQDPALRAEIEGRIAELRSQASAAAMAHELAELEASRRRAYPWLPLDFFVLIGERPVVDEWALYESLGAPPRPASLEGPAAAEPAPSAPSTPDAAASGASSLEGRPED